MASTDALPIPRKNVAYRVTFDGRKNDGTLITSGTGMDSEISKDQGTFADCTNEATEIATNSGVYYLDLTSTEMNADTVAIKVTWTNTGALPQVIVLNPEETGDIRVNVTQMASGVIAAATFAANALDAVWSTATRLLTAGTNIVLAKGTGVTGFNDVSAAQVNAEVVDVLVTDTFAEPAAVPAATASLKDKIGWVFMRQRNKHTQDGDSQTVYADDGITPVGEAAASDNETTFTVGKYS